MCYSTKVMMLRFVVLLTLTVALAECRVSVLTNIIIHVLITTCLIVLNFIGTTAVVNSVERCL